MLSVRAKRLLISCTDLGRELERLNFNAGSGAQFTAPHAVLEELTARSGATARSAIGKLEPLFFVFATVTCMLFPGFVFAEAEFARNSSGAG